MKLEDYKIRIEKQKKWDEDHYIQAFFREMYYEIFYRFPRRIGDTQRSIKWGFQRMFRGYDDTAFWNLDSYITDIAIPVLKSYRQYKCSHPSSLESQEEWNSILDKMINSFELMKADEWKSGNDFEKKQIEIEEGLQLFGKYFQGLWD